MESPLEITVKWYYPYNEAVGAKETKERFDQPVTVREAVEALVIRYPALDASMEKNINGEHNVLVCINNRGVNMQHLLEAPCMISVFPPLSGG